MRIDRIRRWQWIVLSLVVGTALALLRQVDSDRLPEQMGEGVGDQRWFEREILRQVPLANGSSIRGFDRLVVYPSWIQEGGRRRQVHLVTGVALDRTRTGADPAGRAPPAAVGKLRPCFFVASVPFQPLVRRDGGGSAAANGTVLDYLDGLRSQGVVYTYAWWNSHRYRAAAWVGGSFVLIGLLWPTAVNLLTHGSLRALPGEAGFRLWNVKNRRPSRRQRPVRHAAHPTAAATPSDRTSPEHHANEPGSAATAASPILQLQQGDPGQPAVNVERDKKSFGASPEDFYPTELKSDPATNTAHP
jgi:hypothetical protein